MANASPTNPAVLQLDDEVGEGGVVYQLPISCSAELSTVWLCHTAAQEIRFPPLGTNSEKTSVTFSATILLSCDRSVETILSTIYSVRSARLVGLDHW